MKKYAMLMMLVVLGCLVGMAMAEAFQVQATADVEYGNDGPGSSTLGPTSRSNGSGLGIRNLGAPRRRVAVISYNISAAKVPGKVFKDVFFSILGTKDNKGELSIFGVKEALDDYDVNSGSWSTCPGLANDPLPELNTPISLETLDLNDLSQELVTFTGIQNGSRISTEPSLALDDFINSDTDGILLFLIVGLHEETDNAIIRPINYTTAGTGYGDPEMHGVVLAGELMVPTWANTPTPANNATVSTAASALSWTNPEPNLPEGEITCDVYFGTDPNELLPNYGLTLVEGASGISETSIAMPVELEAFQTYYWLVNVHDSSRDPELTEGLLWTFNTNNKAPVVTAADDAYIWLNNAGDPATATAPLIGTVKDDGLPDNSYTVKWTQTSGPEVVIDPNDVTSTSVVLPEAGTYVFRLTANDGDLSGFDEIQIMVAETPCLAAKAKPGYTPFESDLDGDCLVSLTDLAIMVSEWLNCNSLAPCY